MLKQPSNTYKGGLWGCDHYEGGVYIFINALTKPFLKHNLCSDEENMR